MKSAHICSALVVRHRVKEECGESAHYWWTPRNHPARMQAMCKTHGDEIAGNFRDELTLISSPRGAVLLGAAAKKA